MSTDTIAPGDSAYDNAHAADVFDALTRAEIPVEIVGLQGLLRLPEVAEVVATLTLLHDLTEQRMAQERIHRLAHHDTLTGLDNRLSLNLRLEQLLTRIDLHQALGGDVVSDQRTVEGQAIERDREARP